MIKLLPYLVSEDLMELRTVFKIALTWFNDVVFVLD